MTNRVPAGDGQSVFDGSEVVRSERDRRVIDARRGRPRGPNGGMVSKRDDADTPIVGGQERRCPRGREVGAGTGMGDADLFEAASVQQPGHSKIGRVVVGQRGEVHLSDPQRLDHPRAGSKVERLVAAVAPPFGVVGQGALQVDEETISAPHGGQHIALKDRPSHARRSFG